MTKVSDNPDLEKFLHDSLFLSSKHKLVYISTPKVACTSLKWWFAELVGVKEKILSSDQSNESDPELVIHDLFGNAAPDVTGLFSNELQDAATNDSYSRFALVRNPYKRIFSAWQSKILLAESLQSSRFAQEDFFRIPVESGDDIARSFELFLEYLSAHEYPNFEDDHWTPQERLLRPDLIHYAMLSKLEELSEMRGFLQGILGPAIRDPFEVQRSNESLIPYHHHFITRRSGELIRSLYRADFSEFQYPLEIPRSTIDFDQAQIGVALKGARLVRGRNLRLGEIRSRFYSELQSVNQQLSLIGAKTAELSQTIGQTTAALAQRDQQLAAAAERLEQVTAALTQGIVDARNELHTVLNSRSWKLTSPLRLMTRIAGRLRRSSRFATSSGARVLWRTLPGRPETKTRFKERLFAKLPLLFSWSSAYSASQRMNGHSVGLARRGNLDDHGRTSTPTDHDTYVPILRTNAPTDLPARVIAFYLPQFHAIAENNEWWGQGFTEWTNVKPAVPQFDGHYQPHLPDELGYYNLLERDVQLRQIELAKLYGIGGFCFYYYWFNGQRLLEQPIENYLNDPQLDHPFCLCWANENWSRRWDGKDSEMLIAQQHSPEDDLAVAVDLARYVKDKRYIRIDGKPLIVVYRPSLLPSARETSERWRRWFRENGIGEIYLAYTQSFESVDPAKYGFDAAIEFPPNNSAPPEITQQIANPRPEFSGIVYDWSIFPKRAAAYKDVGYHLFRSVCPSWDNTARRKNRGTVFLNSTPEAYQGWLEDALAQTQVQARTPDERIVFVNAWNEWAEGAHLEPDQKYGYAWLEATRRALTGEPKGIDKNRIAIVTHDAHPHGAQFLALGMVRSFDRDLKFAVDTVILGSGRLRPEFERYSAVHDLLPGADFAERARTLAGDLKRKGVKHSIVNTTVSGSFVQALAECGIVCISLIHEMPGVIEAGNLQSNAQLIAQYAHRVVFPAPVVADGFRQFAQLADDKTVIRPQGLWRRNAYRLRRDRVRAEVRHSLNAPADAPMVLAVGYADKRKGVDLFVQAAMQALKSVPNAIFVWIGHWDETLRADVMATIGEASPSFRFLGYEPNTARYHIAADLYALSSREDPFPNVVLESFDAGVPVVAFSGTGGGSELVATVGGRVVTTGDATAFGNAIVDLLGDPEIRNQLGKDAAVLVDSHYAFRDYLFELCDLAGIHLPRISVVVPNYNYERHITARLDSILYQTMPIFEIIIMDDASTDDSVEVIARWIEENAVETRIVINERNSGSVFDQWELGSRLARGDFLWIAEADDLSEAGFLEAVIAPMERDPVVAMSYCESQQINEFGYKLANNYGTYLKMCSEDHWLAPYVSDGDAEVSNYLAIQNTIPNVSGVVFRRDRLSAVLQRDIAQIRSFRRAGDWLTYINVLKNGKIAYQPRALNIHRRHAKSVIGGSAVAGLITEIETIQKMTAASHPLSAETEDKAASYLSYLKTGIKA